jgi:REase_DpnII-MboI
MLVSQLKQQLEEFRRGTVEHRDLWGASLEPPLPDYPVSNIEELNKQSASLLRLLGRLRPYLQDLHSSWVLAGAGRSWNVLDQAFGNQIAAVKGPSLNAVADGIQVALGRLDDYLPDAEFRLGQLTTNNADIELAERICFRVNRAARILCLRHNKRPPLEMADEYDVQDLLHALFRAYFKYPVTENPLSKIAGAASTRVDLSIEELGLLVEVKFARNERDQRKIEKELAEDLVFYSKWEPLKYLFFVIFNSADLENAELLEKFSKPQTINEKHFNAKVINV